MADGPRVRVLDFPDNRGKIPTLNDGVREAHGEIVVFSDATALLYPDSLRWLMMSFADPKVGAASGRYTVIRADEVGIGKSEDFYWKYETYLKVLESQLDSMLGAHGHLHAIRRDLYPYPPPGTINDDYIIPVSVLSKGYRAVYEPKAVVYEEAREMTGFGRRVRIMAGNLQQLREIRGLLRPFRLLPLFFFLSHKVSRLVVPFAMVAALVASCTVIASPFYRALLRVAGGLLSARAGRHSGSPPAEIAHAALLFLHDQCRRFLRRLSRANQPAEHGVEIAPGSIIADVSDVTPAVTVAIPVYSPKFISQTLDSVIAQTFQDFEIVVVNDGSPETSALEAVLEPYRSRIRYICQENAGGAAARNTAIRAARAPLIVNLDHDDLLDPDHLRKQVAFMVGHPQIDACYVNLLYFGGGPLDGTHWMDHNPSNGDVSLLSVLEGRTCPANPGSILRRDTLLRVGLYDPDVDSWDDFDMWLRILYAGGRIAYNKEALVRYRLYGGNLSSRRLYYMTSAVRVIDKAQANMTLTAEQSAALAARRKLAVFDLEILQGKEAIKQRDWPAALKHFEFCQAQSPTLKLRAVVIVLRWFPGVLSIALRLRNR